MVQQCWTLRAASCTARDKVERVSATVQAVASHGTLVLADSWRTLIVIGCRFTQLSKYSIQTGIYACLLQIDNGEPDPPCGYASISFPLAIKPELRRSKQTLCKECSARVFFPMMLSYGNLVDT